MRKKEKRKKRNDTATSPPAAHRNRGCNVTGDARRGSAVKKRRSKEEQRPILDANCAREKKRGEEEKLTDAMWYCGGGGVRNHRVLRVVRWRRAV